MKLPKALAEAAQNEYNARLLAAKNQYTSDFNAIAALPGGIETKTYQDQLDNEKKVTIDAAEEEYNKLENVTVDNVAGILSKIASFYEGKTVHSKAYNDAKTKSDENVKNNDGVYAYLNTCDETNNTAEVIDNEMIILDTEIEPARGAGKMVNRLTIRRTGGITSNML